MKPNGIRGPLVTLGDHLKAKRLALGMFQKDVAVQLGVDHFTLLNWEKNRTTPLVTAYPGIVAFLGYDPAPTPVTVPDRLKARRREMGWTIDACAQALDVDPTSYARWEQGGTVLLREHRKRLAAVLGIDPDVLDQDMSRAWSEAHQKRADVRPS